MKILHLDIETAPHIAYIWGLRDKFIPLDRLIEPGYTMCWAAKWHGGRNPVMFRSLFEHGKEETIHSVHALLEEADAVVHYNGNKFDIPTLNQEFMFMGLNPPAPSKHIDLLRTARSRFRLPSNKLDYVAQVLGLGNKVKHKGMTLWHECMQGDEKAWNTMKRYNKKDVLLLERVYNKLLPWIPNHPNRALYVDSPDKPVCPSCGSTHIHSRGVERTKTMVYRRFQCQSCGTWARGRTNITSPEHKAHTLVGVK